MILPAYKAALGGHVPKAPYVITYPTSPSPLASMPVSPRHCRGLLVPHLLSANSRLISSGQFIAGYSSQATSDHQILCSYFYESCPCTYRMRSCKDASSKQNRLSYPRVQTFPSNPFSLNATVLAFLYLRTVSSIGLPSCPTTICT